MGERIVLESLSNSENITLESLNNNENITPESTDNNEKYFYEQFNYSFDEYRVKEGGPIEKAYSILIKMGNENIDQDMGRKLSFRNAVITAENNGLFPELKKGDLIVLELEEGHRGYIKIGNITYRYDTTNSTIVIDN
ncbi:hypothetical protein D8B46_07925 [Candidatus Gracilibacteria bacterium]|nr:MAG: hypothetical protein D8B46_07925 [Candidatus Gracilibacteria bacterium]